jgi:hypothetical protein
MREGYCHGCLLLRVMKTVRRLASGVKAGGRRDVT